MSDGYIEHVKNTRDRLNKVGPGFCLMKWLNETLYLHTGDNHSCYHPRPHNIPLDELEKDCSALHNTKFKKKQRKIMLEGGMPKECYYCWNIENLKGDHYSDRMFHSASDWIQYEDLEMIKNMKWDDNINPRFLELSFNNSCNFKCGYCCPQSSSRWVDEVKKYGNYDVTYNQYGIEFLEDGFHDNDENNPYLKAFWKWWPDLKNDLRVLRLTGGEPLTNPNFFKMLNFLDKEPAPNLSLNINTNLGVSNKKVQETSELISKLLKEKKIKSFKGYTSIDSWGEQAEYMRRGLKCDIWEKNLETLISITGCNVTFMITYNVLSVAYFKPLLEKIISLRHKFNNSKNTKQKIGFDTPYLKEPPHWMMNILPVEDFGHYLDSDLKFIKDNLIKDKNDKFNFNTHEFEKFKRVRDYFYDGGDMINDNLIKRGRRDFYSFFKEYDKRGKTNFNLIFPKYKNFMSRCKTIYNNF